MSVLICGDDRERLMVTGDIEAELRVPPDADGDGRYWLTFSDGTLIEAAYGAEDAGRFAVKEEGAGITHICPERQGDVLRLDWRLDWVTVAAAVNGARAPQCQCESMPELPELFS